jgi:D-arabinose 1-dehydrogenase-like Zn-dependent alcohol dehydrogenase
MASFEIKGIKGSASKELEDTIATRPALTTDEVYIEITHSGVCGTDEHYRGVDMVLGHEGVGVVRAVGPEVKKFKM